MTEADKKWREAEAARLFTQAKQMLAEAALHAHKIGIMWNGDGHGLKWTLREDRFAVYLQKAVDVHGNALTLTDEQINAVVAQEMKHR